MSQEIKNYQKEIDDIEKQVISLKQGTVTKVTFQEDLEDITNRIQKEARRLTFVIPQMQEGEDFLESSDLDFNQELGIQGKVSLEVPGKTARKSYFSEQLMFEKTQQTALTGEDIDRILKENSYLNE